MVSLIEIGFPRFLAELIVKMCTALLLRQVFMMLGKPELK